jgi:hypothetical protein
MFSFIRKFFERRKAIAAERNRLCNDLLRRVSWALSDYIDASKTKDSLQKWIDDKSKLLVEVSDISEFKRTSYYKQLKQQVKVFDDFYAQAPNKIKAFVAEERQKRADAEYVSKKVNQWASEQKSQKVKASKAKELGRKITKLTMDADDSNPANEACTCCGKDGRKKMLYSTEGEAQIVAEYRSKEIGIPLRVYPCPNGCGFHLTSNQF